MDHNELAAMKAELQRMQSKIEELETQPHEAVNRRHMLRGLGVAAAGAAVGGLAFARPAAAVATNIQSESSLNTAAPTRLIPGGGGSYSSSIGGKFTGAFTVTDDANFSSLNAAFSCVTAYADSSQTGGHTIGLFGMAKSGIGAKLDGPVPLKLTDNTNSGAPDQTTGTNGQFKVDDGDLWFCANDASSTRRWRKLTGAAVAGAFHPVTPGRVYDSRPAQGGVGPLAGVGNRTISVANRINPVGGALLESNFVPAGASAVAMNITAVTTVGNGYFTVNPGGITTVGASAINWTNTQTIANGIIATLNTTRQLTIVAGNAATSANFIIDITGYYI